MSVVPSADQLTKLRPTQKRGRGRVRSDESLAVVFTNDNRSVFCSGVNSTSRCQEEDRVDVAARAAAIG
jgi:hypothetical protein